MAFSSHNGRSRSFFVQIMADTAAAILDAIVASARRRLGPRAAYLKGIDPKSFYRARQTGWLSRADIETLLERCEEHQRDALLTRWLDFRQQRHATRSLHRLGVADILSPSNNHPHWSTLARALTAPITEEPWLRPDGISPLLDQLVEHWRQRADQEEALRNALILMRAALAGSSPDRVEVRLTLLSIIVAALKVAGVLGHRRAQRWIRIVLADLYRSYPADDQIRRVLLTARGLELSHASGRTKADLRQAIEFHADEAALSRQHVRDGTLAKNWPVIYREVRGAAWNLMNLRLDAGFGISLAGGFFQQHLEWQAITEDHMPPGYRLAENPSLAIETAAYDVRFRAAVFLDRPNRTRSLRGGHPETAIFEIDNALNSKTAEPYINQLTRGHLLGLRAEALLCLYAHKPTPSAKDEYVNSRDAAAKAYQAAADQANSHFWALSLKRLERSVGF